MNEGSIAYWGAAGFGCIIGWLVYYINRYRKAEVQFSDLTTIVGIVGGAAVTSLFGGADKALFGAYGIGLFLGFFGYFVTLLILVRQSGGIFTATWFLDGRRKRPTADEEIQGTPPGTDRPPMDVQFPMQDRMEAIEGRQANLEQVVTGRPPAR